MEDKSGLTTLTHAVIAAQADVVKMLPASQRVDLVQPLCRAVFHTFEFLYLYSNFFVFNVISNSKLINISYIFAPSVANYTLAR